MQPSMRLAGSLVLLTVLATTARAADRDASAAGGSAEPYASAPADPGPYPPNAEPGQCFAKVIVPARTESYSEQVMVTPPRTVQRVVPGQCGFQERTVVVREPSVDVISIPATYRNVTETVVVRPAGVRVETLPATFENVEEHVLVRPAYTAWQPSHAPGGFAPGGYGEAGVPPYAGAPIQGLATGEVLCLVLVPAEYRIIIRQVMRTPARTIEIPYPAQTALVSRQVVDTPARQERREIPGETQVVRDRICAPNQTLTDSLPAEFRAEVRTRTLSPARLEWRQIACHAPRVREAPAPAPIPTPPARRPHRHLDDCRCRSHAVMRRPRAISPKPSSPAPTSAASAAPAKAASSPPPNAIAPTGDRAVRAMQGSLSVKGYYKGPEDGLFTQDTMDAMKHFQRDNHLAEGRFTPETANALGVRP